MGNRPANVAREIASAEPEPLLVDAQAAARLLSLSRRTVWEMARRGELPSIKVHGRRLFSVERLRAWVRQHDEGVSP
jgi:excisionase family DNA binding protein